MTNSGHVGLGGKPVFADLAGFGLVMLMGLAHEHVLMGLAHEHMLMEPDPGPNELKSWPGEHIRASEFDVAKSKFLKNGRN